KPARIFVEVTGPAGLPIDRKRKLMRGLTEVAGRAYGLTNLREVLVSLDEHEVDDFATNGFLQTENPEFAAPAVKRGGGGRNSVRDSVVRSAASHVRPTARLVEKTP